MSKKSLCIAWAMVVLLIFTPACTLFQTTTSTPEPAMNLGDYGDAPDGDLGMDTGYYGAAGGPFVFTFQSLGVRASFPTVGADTVPGPFTVDVDDFYIGPLYAGYEARHVPSVELDATDANDPDGLANLLGVPDRADCDKENGDHNPAGTGCQPVPPYSIPMNARLVIMFGAPPLGVFITSVHVAPDTTLGGPAYWNLLIDLNQDGSWGTGEWIAQDVPVNLTPGERVTLISPAIRWPTSGNPWGRLIFPLWARSMVTLESVKDTLGTSTWDGRGIESGFSYGEVEDYFLEWRPLGQRFPQREPEPFNQCQPQDIPTVYCPSGGNIADSVACEVADYSQLHVLCHPQGGGEVFGSGSLMPGDGSLTTCQTDGMEVNIELTLDGFTIRSTNMLDDSMITVYAEPMADNLCQGRPPLGLAAGFWEVLAIALSETPELNIFGMWLFESVVNDDPSNHHPWVGLLEAFRVLVRGGSIAFEGDPPWVNVYGTLNEDGTFFAEGRGTVAGYADIAVTFEGTISPTGLTGDYTMGAEGGLPGGDPIVYAITGSPSPEEEEEPPTEAPMISPGMLEAIESFAAVFNEAFQNGDTDTLLGLLHPAVIDLYGEEACQVYLEQMANTPIAIEVLDAMRVGSWDWEIDDRSTPIPSVYAVRVNRAVLDQTDEIEVHLALPGDDSVRWFSDCGDPLQ